MYEKAKSNTIDAEAIKIEELPLSHSGEQRNLTVDVLNWVPDDEPNVDSTVLYHEESNETYKKKGFYYALSNPNRDRDLPKLLDEHNQILLERLQKLQERFEIKITAGKELHAKWEAIYQEKEQLKQRYEQEIWDKATNLPALRARMEETINELAQLAKQIGLLKDGLIEGRIKELQREINGIINLYQELEDKQNKKFEDEFKKEYTYNKVKLDRLTDAQKEANDSSREVKQRLSILKDAGINEKVSGLLIALGYISAFISGWFFDLWSELDGSSNTLTHSSVRFFLIDSIAKLTVRHSYIELIIGVFLYLVVIGGVSYGCYWLMQRLGFISKRKKIKQMKQDSNGNNELENLILDLNDDDNLFHSRLRAHNWLALWLKATPILLFLFLTLAIVARYAFDTAKDPFQELFNSYGNQFIGSLIAFLFAGLMILYIAKIIEPKHLKETSHQHGRGSAFYWEMSLVLLSFLIMVGIMVLFKASSHGAKYGPTMAVSGFIVSVLSTGLILGYGYRFQGLQEMDASLEEQLDQIAWLRHRLSSPYHVSYLRFRNFQISMLKVQMAAQQLVENRNRVADEITGGSVYPVSTSNSSKDSKSEISKWTGHKSQKGKHWFVDFLNGIKTFFADEKPLEAPKVNPSELHAVTETDKHYYPGFAAASKVTSKKIALLHDEIQEIEREQKDLLRNERTVRSLNDQRLHASKQVYHLSNKVAELQKSLDREKEKCAMRASIEANELQEGYFTGLWYLNRFK